MVVMMYVPLDAENETATTTTDPATTLPSTRGRSPRQDAHFHAHPIDLPAMNVEMHSSYFADVGFPTCPSAYDLPVDDGAGTNGSLVPRDCSHRLPAADRAFGHCLSQLPSVE